MATGGAQGDGDSIYSDLSADGRYVAFSSRSTNLVSGDTNAVKDVFVRDRTAATTQRASVSSGGAQANAAAATLIPRISDDGRFVAFDSPATNLVAGDSNGAGDVFLRNRALGRTTRVSTDALGNQAGGGDTGFPALSGDGRYVAFESEATNLDLLQPDTDGVRDVFVKFSREPRPTAISPPSGARGTNVNVTISGTGFEAGDQVGFSGGGVTVTNVNVTGDGTITATFQIPPGAATGARKIGVSRVGGAWNTSLGAAGACDGCFTITP